MTQERCLAKGLVERIGTDAPNMKYEREDGKSFEKQVDAPEHHAALRLVCQSLIDPEFGVLESLDEVEAIGHRVVHGGEKFTDSVLVDEHVKAEIRECFALAPLHNPPNLGGIEACEEVFNGTPNIAVFDTAFHQTMPPEAYLYAIPRSLYRDYGIRKYGFHGTSHKFVCQATAKYLGRPLSELRLITCHLGNGSSIAAVDGGRVVDTSMGMTPLMGLVMGTRCGDLDPAVVLHLIKNGMTADEIDTILNKKSGLLALAEIGSSDMRDIIAAAEGGNEFANQTLDIFAHRLVSYIGSYYALLGGADAIVMTGGIGENSIPGRARVVSRLRGLGCILDEERNDCRGGPVEICTPESTLRVIVMPTDEELMIGRETQTVAKALPA
jgi:acetate kinase